MTRVDPGAGDPVEPRHPAHDHAGRGRRARERDAGRAAAAASSRERRAPPGAADRAPQADVRDQLARTDTTGADLSRARRRHRRPGDQHRHEDPSRRMRRAGCCGRRARDWARRCTCGASWSCCWCWAGSWAAPVSRRCAGGTGRCSASAWRSCPCRPRASSPCSCSRSGGARGTRSVGRAMLYDRHADRAHRLHARRGRDPLQRHRARAGVPSRHARRRQWIARSAAATGIRIAAGRRCLARGSCPRR